MRLMILLRAPPLLSALSLAESSASSSAPPHITLRRPVLVSACTGGCVLPAATQLAPGVLAMPLHSWEHTPGAQALAVSTDGGAVFSSLNARGTGGAARWTSIWGASGSPELLAAFPNVRYDNGILVRQPGNTSWTSTFRTRFEWDASTHVLRVTNESTAVTFTGLPRPATAPPLKFSQTGFLPPSWIRFDGSSIVHLGNSTWLRTAIVCFSDNPQSPAATSIVAFVATDGGLRWGYAGTIADAKTYMSVSMEGPNEHDLVRLPNGRLVIVMRFDGGDGHDSCLRNCTAEWKPYFWSTSDTDGRSWSLAVPMVGTGSARPRLLLVGSTLLLSGGRMRYRTADGVGPSTDNDLWAADATVVATGTMPPVWRTYALSYWHNHLYDGAEGLPGRYTARVNSTATNRPETRSYGALLPACTVRNGMGSCAQAVVFYSISSGDFTNGSTTANNSVAVAGSTAGIAPHCGTSSVYEYPTSHVGRYCTYAFSMRIDV
eukprot:COSAG01_NODE_869_length_13031_cov_28.329467_7_plen_490_part_00